MREARAPSGFSGKAATLAAILLLAVAAAPAAAQEKAEGKKQLNFKSRVINAPNARGSVGGAVTEALREAYAKSQGAPLTADQRSELMTRLEKAFRLNRSDEGLKEVQSRNGTVSIDLQGRFQYIYLARTNPDGSVSVGCVTDWEGARAFLAGAGGAGIPSAEKE
jgi:hypothetical protein